ncbi:hypothetical protein ALQ37_200232 [Pseudomonas syringae pv. aptata]|uniref:Uncharacterized protein n=1 Tax=Pseudomonas syringae pv. aptata TaxID=83167 RepID=A0A3M3X655_PSEAP|nr:hypothetical protein [Pseudomonas syringae]RMO65446.1 hypothetical protein ALQ37_200232 [Pseudomonas syringae pv. aptata]
MSNVRSVARFAVTCLVVFSVTSTTNAKLLNHHAPARNLDVWQGLPSLDLAVCADPLVMQEFEKTNVLRALLGEDVQLLQVAGR